MYMIHTKTTRPVAGLGLQVHRPCFKLVFERDPDIFYEACLPRPPPHHPSEFIKIEKENNHRQKGGGRVAG